MTDTKLHPRVREGIEREMELSSFGYGPTERAYWLEIITRIALLATALAREELQARLDDLSARYTDLHIALGVAEQENKHWRESQKVPE